MPLIASRTRNFKICPYKSCRFIAYPNSCVSQHFPLIFTANWTILYQTSAELVLYRTMATTGLSELIRKTSYHAASRQKSYGELIARELSFRIARKDCIHVSFAMNIPIYEPLHQHILIYPMGSQSVIAAISKNEI